MLRARMTTIGTRMTRIGRIHTDLIVRFRPLNEKPVSQYGEKNPRKSVISVSSAFQLLLQGCVTGVNNQYCCFFQLDDYQHIGTSKHHQYWG